MGRAPGSNRRDWGRLARRLSALAGAALAGAVALLWTAPDWLIDQVARQYPGCTYRFATKQPLIALTFDDGPDPATTPLILAELRRHDAHATFFLISGSVPGQERLLGSMVESGHELGNHFTRDRPSIDLEVREFEHDLLEAHRVLGSFAPVRWARPGSGWYTQGMIEVMHRHGYRCALGSIYPFDVAIPSVSWASRYILRNARAGGIVVLHDGGARGRRTARVLSRVLPELQRLGYRLVTLSELLAAAT